jgi:hypothetical protein
MSIQDAFASAIEAECKSVIDEIMDGLRDLDELPISLWNSLPQEAIDSGVMDLGKVEKLLLAALEDDLFPQVEKLAEIADEVDFALLQQEREAAQQPQPES